MPVLPPDGRGVLGCVALDVPPRHVHDLSEGHSIIEGLRAIADSLGSPQR